MLDFGGMIDDAVGNIGGMVDDAIDDFGGTISNAADDFLGGGMDTLAGPVTGALDTAIDVFGLGAPNVNEEALTSAAQGWTSLGDHISDALDVGSHVSRSIADGNIGQSINSFLDAFGGHDSSPLPGGDMLVQGVDAVAGGLLGSAGAAHAAKLMAVIQGVQYASKVQQAVAAAPATGGQSLTLIPGFRELAAGNVQGAIATAAQFLDGGSTGPVHGLLGEMLQGTGLIDRLDGQAPSTPPAAGAPAPALAPAAAPAPGAAPGGPPPGGGGDVDGLVQSYLDRNIPYAWGGGHGAEPGPTQGISDGGGPADAHGDYNKVGLDCSGLAREFLWQQKGIDIGAGSTHTTIDQGTPVSEADLQPGDLVYPNPGHVQVYIGDGEVLEAPQSGEYVKVSPYAGGELRRYE